MTVAPLFGTELRYEQYAADRLLGANDAIQVRARPGLAVSSGPWSINAVSDAAIAVRRSEAGAAAERAATRPDALQLDELRLEYNGIPRTAISLGRQQLGIAGAAITGDRDGQQTFDAARLRWNGVPGLSADLAYAWSSSSLWAADRLLPTSVPGENIFAQLAWTSGLGTISGYAYQIDQRDTADSQFRLLNQVYGARFSGSRRLGEDLSLAWSLGFVRQTGALDNPTGGAPTYWQIGNRLDLADLTASQISYRRFAANGISTLNGNTLSLATSATRGRMTVGAQFNDFRPLSETGAISNRNLRLSLGLIF
ncbi:MAG: hypothetical protein EOP61_31045 [Sphingomonadales bacterium]|nr:MAG: hypothetical protein EOP61_31045 [Sphingomonadales bacterium]